MNPSLCDLAQVDDSLLQANANGHPVVQVVNSLTSAPTHCGNMNNVINIETSAQGMSLVQVDPLLSNTSAHDGVDVVQVDDIYCNTSDNGRNVSSTHQSDVVQVVNVYKSATASGSDLVQVGHSYNPSKFQREGPHVVKCSRGIKRKRS